MGYHQQQPQVLLHSPHLNSDGEFQIQLSKSQKAEILLLQADFHMNYSHTKAKLLKANKATPEI